MNAVVQLRGDVNVNREVEDTLDMLNIGRVNHCTLVPETDAYDGMVAKVNDVVAFGEPSADVLATVIERRADPLEGEGDVDDEWVAAHTDHDSVADLTEALLAEETTLREAGLSPAIRLHPPRGGHAGIKHPTAEGGQLGEHPTEAIDELLESMR